MRWFVISLHQKIDLYRSVSNLVSHSRDDIEGLPSVTILIFKGICSIEVPRLHVALKREWDRHDNNNIYTHYYCFRFIFIIFVFYSFTLLFRFNQIDSVHMKLHFQVIIVFHSHIWRNHKCYVIYYFFVDLHNFFWRMKPIVIKIGMINVTKFCTT